MFAYGYKATKSPMRPFCALNYILYAHALKTPLKAFYGLVIA